MRLTALRAADFRNFSTLSLSFDPNLNLFIGHNGQGKTNLLEAIYTLGHTKSFRTHLLAEATRSGAAGWRLQGDVEVTRRTTRLEVSLGGRSKRLLVDGRTTGVVDYLGHLDAVTVTTYHTSTIRGYPDERRRFIDRALLYLQPSAVRMLTDYQKTLKQKNSLLLQIRRGASEMTGELDAWNEQLVEHGTAILLARRDLIAQLQQTLQPGLFAGEQIEIEYRPNVALEPSSSANDCADSFRRALAQERRKEMRVGHSLVGPHRDDLEILLGGSSLQRFGSAGQQRSALYALHFAILELYFRRRRDYPLFLIDDIDAELDVERIHSLVDHLKPKCQVFITTAKEHLVESYLSHARIFRVAEGNVNPI